MRCVSSPPRAKAKEQNFICENCPNGINGGVSGKTVDTRFHGEGTIGDDFFKYPGLFLKKYV